MPRGAASAARRKAVAVGWPLRAVGAGWCAFPRRNARFGGENYAFCGAENLRRK